MANKPGEKCEQSGIYKVNHDHNHEKEHEVTVVYGEPFPPCNGCGKGVTFTVARAAIHLTSHSSFKK
jgi:hypothetical protein